MKVVYLIGQPGAGKTTVTRAVTFGLIDDLHRVPFKHVDWSQPDGRAAWTELGWPRDEFGGTDTLGMHVQPLVLGWLEAREGVVFGEGDRLGNASFFEAVRASQTGLTVVWLDTPDDVAAARRLGRGSTQNEAWLRGRVTKVARLAEQADVRLDGTLPAVEHVETLRGLLGC